LYKPKLLVNMKKLHQISLLLLVIFLAAAVNGCKKDAGTTTDSLYVPTSADATTSATLTDLQQGRELYISNCGGCHSLYSPDNYTASQWRNIMPNMAPNTNLTSAQVQLVTKYVTKGK
jgi:mono/diheme cytochrome c family protein